MVTNTLIGTDDDLGDTVATYGFDARLARSLLLTSGLTFAGCSAVGVTLSTAHLVGDGVATSILLPMFAFAIALMAIWGLTIAVTRLHRKDDLFVVHRFGLARHHGGGVTRTRWVDIASVRHAGADRGSRIARWNGSDYACHIDLRDGTSTVFDNYVVDAAALGRDIEQRSLL